MEIQVSAVKLNYTCGPTEHVFNASLTPQFFQTPDYPKPHYRFLPCQTTFKLPPELRQKYKMKMSTFQTLLFATIEIDLGENGITTRNDRMTRSFTFESPTVSLKYSPQNKRLGDVFSIEIEIVERQDGCECPHQPDISTTLVLEIPTHCKQLDCIYELTHFDDFTVQYYTKLDNINDFVGSRRTGMIFDQYKYSNGKGTYDFDSWTNQAERMIIRYHRENPTTLPSIFRFNYSTSGVHISHAQRLFILFSARIMNQSQGVVAQTRLLLQPNAATDFTSPDWPAHYCDNLVCVITFVAPAHHHLEVKLDTISLEPDSDRIAFFEGTNITEEHIEVVTGELTLSDPISSSGTIMTTVFISNGAVAFDGFNGTITEVIDKSWSEYLKHHISGWWWLFVILLLLSITGAVIIVVKRRGGLLCSHSINLMDM